MFEWSEEIVVCALGNGDGCSKWLVLLIPMNAKMNRWRLLAMEIILPVADTEFRALDIRVFKLAIVAPLLTFGIQYASMTESKSESPSLVSTDENRRWNVKKFYDRQKFPLTSFEKFICFGFFHGHKAFQCSIWSTFIRRHRRIIHDTTTTSRWWHWWTHDIRSTYCRWMTTKCTLLPWS